MKTFIRHILLAGMLCSLAGCTGMDETYKEFLGDGTVYISMADAVTAYPGDGRILVAWNPLKDSRADKVRISWANNTKSIVKQVEHPKDTSVLIPGLEEGSYTFTLTTLDAYDNSSLPILFTGEAYGPYYKGTLFDRLVKTVTKTASGIRIEFHPSASNAFIGQQVRYFSSATQAEKMIELTPEDPLTLTIDDYAGESFSTVSYYNPNPVELDVFSSPTTVEYTPTVPMLTLPRNEMTNVSCCPSFEWLPVLGQESAKYTVQVSADGSSWTDYLSSDGMTYVPRTALKANSVYSWKVKTGTIESPVQTFTTGNKDIYGDKEIVTLNTTSKAKASNIVFIGEGFLQTDYKVGGTYERRALEAYEALFKVEPYKAYKEYFNVYQIAAYSEIRGISIPASTAFGTTLNSETSTLSCTQSKVNAYLTGNIPGFAAADLANTCVIVIVNSDVNAATTVYYNGGQTISLCPLYKNYDGMPYQDFRYIAIRHGGGFGYGLLADESEGIKEEIPADKITELKALWAKNRGLNLDLKPEAPAEPEDNVRWKEFLGQAGYETVGAFEGGYGYSKGVLRSETTSAMAESNIPYFNIASRVAIVKRILGVAGETFDTAAFKSKDSSQMDPTI